MSHIRIKKDTSDYSFYNKRGLIESTAIKDGDVIIVYDTFIRNGRLYFISTYLRSYDPAFRLKVEGHKLTEVGLNEPEPARYFFCDIKPDFRDKELNLFINGTICTLRPEVLALTKKHPLAIATLFKYESGAQVQRFLDYYRMQGVTAFYLYYNGAELPEDLPVDVDVFYRLWDFPYWNDVNMTYMHCAQSVFLTTVRFRILPDCAWLALVDLDEFIYCSGGPLVHYLADLPAAYDVVRVRNYWSMCPDSGGPIQYNVDGGNWLDRTKCIYKGSFKGLFAIHGPKAVGDFKEFKADDLKLLHVVNDLHKDRVALIKEPTLLTGVELVAI